MTKEEKRKSVLNELSSVGITFSAPSPGPGGIETIQLSTQDVLKYVDDPVTALASHYGISVDEYRQWLDEGMSVRCAAYTRIGKRCKNVVKGGTSVSVKKWAQMQGDYCSSHCDGLF